MKLSRLIALPLTVAADIVTFPRTVNGARSYTQQLFDAERHEAECRAMVAMVRSAVMSRRREDMRRDDVE